MNILVINAGSSSLKYQLFDMKNESVTAKGLVERIGIGNSRMIHKPSGKDQVVIEKDVDSHVEAVKLVLDMLVHPEYGAVSDMSQIDAVGHRVVHGGESFSESALIDDGVIAAIKENSDLAPLHNPANLMGIEACRSVMPNTPMVAVFDTAFHQTMPKKAYLYALPLETYTKYKVRRYGFHGSSHRYVSVKAAEYMGKDISELKIITCHLGNGSSIAAIDGGKSVDTSMGLTPLEGVPMGTRSGDIDPAIMEYLGSKLDMDLAQMTTYLNKKSGVYGLSGGISSDYRDLFEAAENGNEDAKNALDVFAYRVRKYIGSYALAMGGVDVIVFTAGIGENNPKMRAMIMNGLDFINSKLDADKNVQKGECYEISTDDSKVKAMVIATNEELVIARDTKQLTANK